jgi:hypothetical protein
MASIGTLCVLMPMLLKVARGLNFPSVYKL